MAYKGRKPGDWKAIASGRDKKERTLRIGRGLTNIPVVTETGSASYRRLTKASKGKR